MITNIVLFVITRNNKVLKDIYSPLEIDDQWDQRAPSHEDKVEGGNTDGMSSVTPEVPVENPSGSGVAVAEKPTQDMSADSDVQPQPVVDAAVTESAADSTAPGMQTNNESYSNITNIGQMTVPASPESTSVEGVSTEPTTTEPTPVSMEEAPTEPTGTETPEVSSDDDAAKMIDSSTLDSSVEHDVPASPFDAKGSESSTDDTEDTESASVNPPTAMPIETVEPDQGHRAETSPSEEDEDNVRSIVEEPLSDQERETVASDVDQMPISPESVVSDSHTSEMREDEVSTEVSKGLEKVLKAIESELEVLHNRKTRLQEKLAQHEQEKADADAKATATQSQIDQVESAISELESKK